MPTREELRGRAQTVLGIVDPAALGSTLMHEHLIWNLTPPALRGGALEDPRQDQQWELMFGRSFTEGNLTQRSVDVAAEAVSEAVAAGCGTIVELTIGGIDPDPGGLAEVARRTGCHIVMGSGHYVEEYQDPANHARSVDDFAAEMVAQVQDGAWGTGVRAGILGEIGCQNPWTALERRVLDAALIAQDHTGAALTIHPGRRPDQPQEVMDHIRASGRGDPSRTIMCHIDRTIPHDVPGGDDMLFRLADTGCVLEWDLFGQESCSYPLAPNVDMPNDAGRLRAIRKLLDRGHRDQVVIAHDICHRAHMSRWGGWGYAHIHRRILPLMRRRGFSEAEIKAIMVDTPRRLLTFV
jgi:phosphotriesterase-related protein